MEEIEKLARRVLLGKKIILPDGSKYRVAIEDVKKFVREVKRKW